MPLVTLQSYILCIYIYRYRVAKSVQANNQRRFNSSLKDELSIPKAYPPTIKEGSSLSWLQASSKASRLIPAAGALVAACRTCGKWRCFHQTSLRQTWLPKCMHFFFVLSVFYPGIVFSPVLLVFWQLCFKQKVKIHAFHQVD